MEFVPYILGMLFAARWITRTTLLLLHAEQLSVQQQDWQFSKPPLAPMFKSNLEMNHEQAN